MKKYSAILVLLLIVLTLPAAAQETYFGKNKVQYRNFEWEFIQTIIADPMRLKELNWEG